MGAPGRSSWQMGDPWCCLVVVVVVVDLGSVGGSVGGSRISGWISEQKGVWARWELCSETGTGQKGRATSCYMNYGSTEEEYVAASVAGCPPTPPYTHLSHLAAESSPALRATPRLFICERAALRPAFCFFFLCTTLARRRTVGKGGGRRTAPSKFITNNHTYTC